MVKNQDRTTKAARTLPPKPPPLPPPPPHGAYTSNLYSYSYAHTYNPNKNHLAYDLGRVKPPPLPQRAQNNNKKYDSDDSDSSLQAKEAKEERLRQLEELERIIHESIPPQVQEWMKNMPPIPLDVLEEWRTSMNSHYCSNDSTNSSTMMPPLPPSSKEWIKNLPSPPPQLSPDIMLQWASQIPNNAAKLCQFRQACKNAAAASRTTANNDDNSSQKTTSSATTKPTNNTSSERRQGQPVVIVNAVVPVAPNKEDEAMFGISKLNLLFKAMFAPSNKSQHLKSAARTLVTKKRAQSKEKTE